MSDEFHSLDPDERAAVERAIDRCRVLADWIESELLKERPDTFVDKLSLADFQASLERAACVLEQKTRDNKPTPTVKRSQEQRSRRQR
jgi:hypothetical protein